MPGCSSSQQRAASAETAAGLGCVCRNNSQQQGLTGSACGHARREFSLGAASLADSVGVALADVAGILIQGCLFRANGLSGADFACGAG